MQSHYCFILADFAVEVVHLVMLSWQPAIIGLVLFLVIGLCVIRLILISIFSFGSSSTTVSISTITVSIYWPYLAQTPDTTLTPDAA